MQPRYSAGCWGLGLASRNKWILVCEETSDSAHLACACPAATEELLWM